MSPPKVASASTRIRTCMCFFCALSAVPLEVTNLKVNRVCACLTTNENKQTRNPLIAERKSHVATTPFFPFSPLLPAFSGCYCCQHATASEKRRYFRYFSAGRCAKSDTFYLPATAGGSADHQHARGNQRAGQVDCHDGPGGIGATPCWFSLPQADRSSSRCCQSERG